METYQKIYNARLMDLVDQLIDQCVEIENQEDNSILIVFGEPLDGGPNDQDSLDQLNHQMEWWKDRLHQFGYRLLKKLIEESKIEVK